MISIVCSIASLSFFVLTNSASSDMLCDFYWTWCIAHIRFIPRLYGWLNTGSPNLSWGFTLSKTLNTAMLDVPPWVTIPDAWKPDVWLPYLYFVYCLISTVWTDDLSMCDTCPRFASNRFIHLFFGPSPILRLTSPSPLFLPQFFLVMPGFACSLSIFGDYLYERL